MCPSVLLLAFMSSVQIFGGHAVTPGLFLELLPENQEPFLDVNQGNVSEDCRQELKWLEHNASKYYEDFLALDAWGKPQSGFLVGNHAWLGHYDECMNLSDYRYCLTTLNADVPNANSSDPVKVTLGLCVPKKCSEKDLINGIFEFGIVVDGLDNIVNLTLPICTKNPHVPYSIGFCVTLALYALILIVIIASSIYQVHIKRDDANEVLPPPVPPDREDYLDATCLIGSSSSSVQIGRDVSWIDFFLERSRDITTCFSLSHNFSKLLSPPPPNSLQYLHGMRVISILWIILVHVYIEQLLMPGTVVNPYTGLSWLDRYGFMVIANGVFSIDSLFFISGLLVCYLTLKRMAKTGGKFPWLTFYFHRFLRVTPLIGVTILLFLYITPYQGYGPLAQMYSKRPNCSDYWWSTLLYINNFYPSQLNQSCLSWTWYLANDMQFFIISPLFILPLYYYPTAGFILICISMVSSMATTGILSYVYQSPATFFDYDGDSQSVGDFINNIYIKPYCRIVPYLTGMLMGFSFYRYKTLQRKIHSLTLLIGLVIASGLGTIAVYLVFPTVSGNHQWQKTGITFYHIFAKLMWSLYLSWIVFVCHYDNEGWIHHILSHRAWVPLSRLTYSAYLLYPLVLLLFLANQGQAIYLSLTLSIFYFVGISIISYACAAFLSLSVEIPLGQLEKAFSPKSFS